MLAITALGHMNGREPVTRAGARAGDVVAISGPVGRSAAGLALLEAGGPHELGRGLRRAAESTRTAGRSPITRLARRQPPPARPP